MTFLFIILLLLSANAEAYFIDTVAIPSKANEISIRTIVILPNKARGENAQNSPVVYLLHGFDGSETDWLAKKKSLPQIADEKNIIIVCPDGKNSWYLDSPIKKDNQYETFISSELVDYIDKHYRTIPNRNYRAITGLSMGGHGALYNAFKHTDVFSAVGSMSGAIDVKQKNNNYGLTYLLPSMATNGNSSNWGSHSVIAQIANLKNQDLAIIIDCGTKDFTIPYNEAIHKALAKKGIDHDYTTRPGTHFWEYWTNSIDYHLLFFHKYFNSHQK
jgi:S-formylglutathione hydrolase FrmB